VLQLSLEMDEYSHGLVTPVVLDALEAAGYEVSFNPGQVFLNSLTPPRHIPTFELSDIEFRVSSREVKMPTGMRLDFGGVAKGWAAHQAMQRLSTYGPVLVNAGGDISISSPRQNGVPWKVGIIDPLQPEVDIVHLSITAGGLATSGKDYRTWRQDGVLRHHIIDPRTGEPAVTDILTSSVYAATIMEAEAAAKILFISGSEEENPWLLEHSRIAVLQVMDDGSLRATQPMQKLFWRENDTTIRSN
jgi:thiamine biosynthesis lipoprotein